LDKEKERNVINKSALFLLALGALAGQPLCAQDSSAVTFNKVPSQIENRSFQGTMVMDKAPNHYGWYLQLDAPLVVSIRKNPGTSTMNELKLDIEDFDRKDEDWNGIHLQASGTLSLVTTKGSKRGNIVFEVHGVAGDSRPLVDTSFPKHTHGISGDIDIAIYVKKK